MTLLELTDWRRCWWNRREYSWQ